MAKFASFAKDFIDSTGGQIMNVLPNIYIDTKRVLCLKNKKVLYEDFTKMVLRGGVYVPVICCDNIGENEPVLDLYPILNAGAAELVALLSNERNFWALKFMDWLETNIIIEDWHSALELVETWSKKSYIKNQEVLLVDALRGSYIDSRFYVIRRIYTLMCALRIVNPKFYCLALMEVLKLSLFTSPLLAINKREIGCKAERGQVYVPNFFYVDTNAIVLAVLVEPHKTLLKWSAISYRSSEDKCIRKISDCRGIGLSLLASFTIQLFREFCDSPGYGIRELYLQNSLEKTFISCLGDDFVGRLLKTGYQEFKQCSQYETDLCRQAGIIPIDCDQVTNREGIPYGRGLDEAALLWKYATGVEKLKHKFLPFANVTYGDHRDILDVCNSLLIKDVPEMLSLAEKESAKAAVSGLNLERLTDAYRRELEKKCSAEAESLRKELEALKQENESLRGSLTDSYRECDSKREIIDKLHSQLSDVRLKVRSMYSETTDIDDYEDCVSTEEMLDFVNQFKLVLLGGIDAMKAKLEQIGLTNVYQIQSHQILTNTSVAGDFFCICTKFVSHSLAEGAEKAYSDKLSQFFWFNGTNADALLRAYYNFAKSWLEG